MPSVSLSGTLAEPLPPSTKLLPRHPPTEADEPWGPADDASIPAGALLVNGKLVAAASFDYPPDDSRRLFDALPGASRETIANIVCGCAVGQGCDKPEWLPILRAILLHARPHSNRVWPSAHRVAEYLKAEALRLGRSIAGLSVTTVKRALRYFREEFPLLRLISDVAERLRGPGEHDWLDAGGQKEGNGPVNHYDASAVLHIIDTDIVLAFEALRASFSTEEIAAALPRRARSRAVIAGRLATLPPAEPPRDLDEQTGDPYDEDSHEAAAQKRQAQARELRGPDVDRVERTRRKSYSETPPPGPPRSPGPPPSGASDQVPADPQGPGEITPPALSSENPAGLLITPHGGGSPLCSVNDTKSGEGDRPEPPPEPGRGPGVDGPKMARINIRECVPAGGGGKPAAKQADKGADEAAKMMRRHPLFRELRKLRYPVTGESFGPGLERLWREHGEARLAEVNGYRLWLQQHTGEKYGPGWFTRTVQQWAGPTGGYAEHLQRQRARRLVEAQEVAEGGNAQARQVVSAPDRKVAKQAASDALDAELSRIEREEPERWDALRSLAMKRMAPGIRSHPERPAFAAIVLTTARAVLRGEIAEPRAVTPGDGGSSPAEARGP
jgi:hypothetical protein